MIYLKEVDLRKLEIYMQIIWNFIRQLLSDPSYVKKFIFENSENLDKKIVLTEKPDNALSTFEE